MAFNDEQFYAAAKWWADQLPGRGNTSPQEIESAGNIRQEAKSIALSINAEMGLPGPTSTNHPSDKKCQIFINEIAKALRTTRCEQTLDGQDYLELATDYGPITPALGWACRSAGIHGEDLPFKTSIYLYDNGQIMVPEGSHTYIPLAYAGQPALPYFKESQIDFTDCPYYMNDDRYLSLDLMPGQEVKTVSMRKEGPEWRKEYFNAKAGENQVLVVGKDATPEFNSLTQKDLLTLENFSSVTSAYLYDKADFTDGAKRKYSGSKIEKLDDEGHFRELSLPFRIKEVTETISIGYAGHYQVLNKGDFLIQEDPNSAHPWVKGVKKATLESSPTAWVRSTYDGKVLGEAPLPKLGLSLG